MNVTKGRKILFKGRKFRPGVASGLLSEKIQRYVDLFFTFFRRNEGEGEKRKEN